MLVGTFSTPNIFKHYNFVIFMGFFDFLRKKKVEEDEVVVEEVAFEDIESWLNGKAEEINEKEKKVFDLIKERVDLFIKEINEKIKILEEVDVEGKKVEERAKIIVKQGLDKYLDFVDIFIKELTEVEKQNLSQLIKDMNKIFSDFDKHSYVFYQRATFLIGDEIAAVKQEINNFSKYFTELFNENQKIVDSSNVISSTKLKIKQLDEINSIIEQVGLDIKKLNGKIEESDGKEKKVLEEVEEIKGSGDYAENLKKLEEVKVSKDEIEKDVGNLRGLIDFKGLSNVFHSSEKSMNVIKAYKENFLVSFQKDAGKEILELLDEANLNSGDVKKDIEDKINSINNNKKKTDEIKKLIKKDKTKELLKESEKIKSEIENLKIEKVKTLKRGEKLKESKEEAMGLIKERVRELGGNLEKT